jgi:hypothetical protein
LKTFLKKSFLLGGLGVLAVQVLFVFGCTPAVMVVPSHIRSVGVDLFENRTSIYGLETTFTQAVLRAFQVDGRLSLEDPGSSDLRIKAVIQRFVEEPLLFDTATNQVRQYRISVVYDISAQDAREKKVLQEDREKIISVIYYTPGYTQAIPETREQALVRLGEDMGRSIVRRVLEGH